MSAAIGANGRPNSTLAGTDAGVRGCIRAAIPASPYQARALTIPVTAATPSAAAVPRCAMTAAPADSTRKLANSQSTERSGGSRRHQATITPPWLSAAAMPSMIGNAARNGQENGSTATPNASVTAGESSSQASAVSAMQDAEGAAQRRGAQLPRPGQPQQRGVHRRPDEQHGQHDAGEPEPGPAVGEQPAQVVVGGEHRKGGDLRRDRTSGRGDEREKSSLGHGPAGRGEDQSLMPEKAPGRQPRAHSAIRCPSAPTSLRGSTFRV